MHTKILAFAFSTLILFLVNFSFAGEISKYGANDQLVNRIETGAISSGSDSVVIEKDGTRVYENFFGAKDRVRNIQSASKSVCALAIEILLTEKKIASLDLPMSTWIHNWKTDPEKSKITLRMILNHTSGIPDSGYDGSFWQNEDVVSAAAATALTHKPGEKFVYSSIGATLLQPVIAGASGQTVKEFIGDRIFAPLEITDAFWISDRAGHERTSGGLSLSTADLLKIGELILHKGTYNARKVLTNAAIDELLSKSQAFKDYGLLWWLGSNDSAYAKGWGGQFIVILFSKNLVAVRTRDPVSIDLNLIDQAYFHPFPDLIATWQ